jgi:hypothetical protein
LEAGVVDQEASLKQTIGDMQGLLSLEDDVKAVGSDYRARVEGVDAYHTAAYKANLSKSVEASLKELTNRKDNYGRAQQMEIADEACNYVAKLHLNAPAVQQNRSFEAALDNLNATSLKDDGTRKMFWSYFNKRRYMETGAEFEAEQKERAGALYAKLAAQFQGADAVAAEQAAKAADTMAKVHAEIAASKATSVDAASA